MRLLLLGATGRTGGHLLTRALAAGHDVTALARAPEKITTRHPCLRTVQGTIADAAAAVPGHDAVLSALGSTSRGPTTVYSDGAAALLEPMVAAGVRRLLCVSSAGLEPGPSVPLAQRLVTRLVIQRIHRHAYADMHRMEELLAPSGLDWTVIRAPMLTDTPATATYRFASGEPLSKPTKISRADLADFMVTHLTDPATYRTRTEISY